MLRTASPPSHIDDQEDSSWIRSTWFPPLEKRAGTSRLFYIPNTVPHLLVYCMPKQYMNVFLLWIVMKV